MTNKLYKDIVLEVDIDAKKGSKNQGKETKATFYSYDINSGIVKMNIKKDGQPLMLPNGSEVLINVVKLGLPQQKLVFRGDVIDGTSGIVRWEIPEQLKGYKGQIRAGVFINLPNGQRLHGGYFKFNMGISEIDTNLEEFEEDYWQGWDEFQKESEAEWSDWKAIRDDTWKKQEEDYDE
ncbi:BppU family phage baseplate upper protein, partial [Tetragenococcus halophilus]